jgi:ATP-dependent DNA helicase RecG
VVYPLVEESAAVDLKAATAMHGRLAKRFKSFRVGLVHGRLKPEERSATMLEFSAGAVQLLVCTTVIEVGVDVANATAMVIEHAARFGLSQLHQLRGRIGRGTEGGTCILMMDPRLGREARARLEVMRETQDGFRIAERDLELRGPGDFLGTRQSGLPELKVVDVVRQRDLLDLAKREAFGWVDALPADPALWRLLPPVLAIRRRWAERLRLAGMG